eukprot:4301275-Amphidinium_carterae.2
MAPSSPPCWPCSPLKQRAVQYQVKQPKQNHDTHCMKVSSASSMKQVIGSKCIIGVNMLMIGQRLLEPAAHVPMVLLIKPAHVLMVPYGAVVTACSCAYGV